MKTVTLKRDTCGDWFVLFSCDDVPKCVLPSTGAVVGIDLGLESFLTASEGEHIANPRPMRGASAGVRKAQRVVSNRARGGTRRKKACDAWPHAIAPSSARVLIFTPRPHAGSCSSTT